MPTTERWERWEDTGRYWIKDDGEPVRMNRFTIAMAGLIREILTEMPDETFDNFAGWSDDRDVMAAVLIEEIVKRQPRSGPRPVQPQEPAS